MFEKRQANPRKRSRCRYALPRWASIGFITIVAVWMAGGCREHTAGPSVHASSVPRMSHRSSKGLRIECDVAASSFLVGEAIAARVRLTNESPTPLDVRGIRQAWRTLWQSQKSRWECTVTPQYSARGMDWSARIHGVGAEGINRV